MAREAGVRESGKAVIHVALEARNGPVRAEKRKRRQLVIEPGSTPDRCSQRMALRTIGRESGRDVIRILRRLKIGIMATDARRRGSRILMLGNTSVARLALRSCVPADEREARLSVALDHIGNAP